MFGLLCQFYELNKRYMTSMIHMKELRLPVNLILKSDTLKDFDRQIAEHCNQHLSRMLP